MIYDLTIHLHDEETEYTFTKFNEKHLTLVLKVLNYSRNYEVREFEESLTNLIKILALNTPYAVWFKKVEDCYNVYVQTENRILYTIKRIP